MTDTSDLSMFPDLSAMDSGGVPFAQPATVTAQNASRGSASNGGADTVPPPMMTNEANFDNPLEAYTEVQYNISMSMVEHDEFNSVVSLAGRQRVYFASTAWTLQGARDESGQEIPISSVSADFTQSQQANVASNGAINSNTTTITTTATATSQEPLYSINEFSVKNIVAVTPNNPELNTLVEMKMKLVEPFGFSFDEEVRTVAPGLGYQGSPTRIVWRIDVWWSGYDGSTGQWVPQIQLTNPSVTNLGMTTGTTVVTYYVSIVNIDVEVTSNGTEYNLSMYPVQQVSLRPEQISIDGMSIEFDGSFQDFCDKLGPAVGDLMKKRTGGQVVKNYQVKMTDFVKKRLGDKKFSYNQFHDEVMNTDEILAGPVQLAAGRDRTILNFIQAALSGVEEVAADLTRDDDPDDVQPCIIYTIRPGISYAGSSFSPNRNDYDNITYVYWIEEHMDWRVRTNQPNVRVSDTLTRQRTLQMLGRNAVRRIYDYIFTSVNTEVLSLNIKLKTFFYYDISNPFDSSALNGVNVRNTPRELQAERTRRATPVSQRPPDDQFNPDLANALISDDRLSQGPPLTHSAPDPLVQLTSTRLDTCSQASPFGGVRSGDGTVARAEYMSQLTSRIYTDLVKLEDMNVRGDPVWLFTAYTGDDTTGKGSVAPVILLNMYAPDQQTYNDPAAQASAAVNRTKISLSGYYQIITVESQMENGKFTQKMSGVRLRGI